MVCLFPWLIGPKIGQIIGVKKVQKSSKKSVQKIVQTPNGPVHILPYPALFPRAQIKFTEIINKCDSKEVLRAFA